MKNFKNRRIFIPLLLLIYGLILLSSCDSNDPNSRRYHKKEMELELKNKELDYLIKLQNAKSRSNLYSKDSILDSMIKVQTKLIDSL